MARGTRVIYSDEGNKEFCLKFKCTSPEKGRRVKRRKHREYNGNNEVSRPKNINSVKTDFKYSTVGSLKEFSVFFIRKWLILRWPFLSAS